MPFRNDTKYSFHAHLALAFAGPWEWFLDWDICWQAKETKTNQNKTTQKKTNKQKQVLTSKQGSCRVAARELTNKMIALSAHFNLLFFGGGGVIKYFKTHPIILGYSQQINFYSLLKWTISKAANGRERPWVIYAPLQQVPGELIYYSPEFRYNILMRCISQCAKYGLCIINQTEISNVWNLRKRGEFFENIALFLFPFFSLVSFFRDM